MKLWNVQLFCIHNSSFWVIIAPPDGTDAAAFKQRSSLFSTSAINSPGGSGGGNPGISDLFTLTFIVLFHNFLSAIIFPFKESDGGLESFPSSALRRSRGPRRSWDGAGEGIGAGDEEEGRIWSVKETRGFEANKLV